MDLIEAINEMKKCKVVKGSNLLNYRIKDGTLEYFYESNWSKTGLSILELTELTFEITENPIKTLSEKIKISTKFKGQKHAQSDVNVLMVSDVREFINDIKSSIRPECTSPTHANNLCDRIDILAGDRFK